MDLSKIQKTEFSATLLREQVLPRISSKILMSFPGSLGLYLYGSQAMNDFSYTSSDIDLVLLFKDLSQADKESHVRKPLEKIISQCGSCGDLLDLSIIPLQVLKFPKDSRLLSFRIEHGEIRTVNGFPLGNLETLSFHEFGETLAGLPLIPLFPIPLPNSHLDDFFLFQEKIFFHDCKFPPFQPVHIEKPENRNLIRFLTRMALLMNFFETGSLTSPSEALQRAGYVTHCEKISLWRDAYEIRCGKKSPVSKDFPAAYVAYLRRMLELAGIGSSWLGAILPTSDKTNFLQYDQIHQNFIKKLSLDFLFHQWVPQKGLRPKRPVPNKLRFPRKNQ